MEALFKKIIQHPTLFLIITLSLMVLASAGAGRFFGNFKSEYKVFFDEANPTLRAFEDMQKTYNKSDNVAFIVSPKDGRVFTRETLTAVAAITQAGWQIPYSTRVDSLTNYQHTVAEGDDLIVEDLVLSPDKLTQTRLQEIEQIALHEPLLRKKLISEKGHVTVVNVTVQLPGVNKTTEVPEVSAAARAMRDTLLVQFPNVDIRLSGIIMMNTAFSESAQQDMATLIPLMFAVVIVALLVLMKTLSGTFATVVIVFASIASTMGLAGWYGLYMTSPTSAAPTMILTLAVADCVHILSSMLYDMRQGIAKRDAIFNSLRINLQPVFLTSITTAIGFLSMNFSDSPPYRDLGNLVALGVMLAFVFSIVLFPALLSLLPIRAPKVKEGSKDYMALLAEFVVTQRRWLLPVMVVVTTVISLGVSRNILDDDFVKYFDTRIPFRQATDYMQENLSGMTSLELSISSNVTSGVNEPKFLQAVSDLTDWLRAQPETDHVSSITDTLKRLNKNMHSDDSRWYQLPGQKNLAAQYLLLYEMSLPYGLDLNHQLDVDKSATRVVVTFKNLTSTAQLKLNQRIKTWFEKNGNGYTLTTASPSLMFSDIGQRNTYSMLTGSAIALVLISTLLAFALRSFKYGVISLLPNLLPATIGFGLWGFFVGNVGLALSVVVGMTLGIIVDYTVHFLSKYLRARREKNLDAADGVRYAFVSVGRALWLVTLVLVAGFLVLANSSFAQNADMGLLTAMTIAIALVVDFLLLPPLLILLDQNKSVAEEFSNEKTSVQHT
jgi:uncharacterized protein